MPAGASRCQSAVLRVQGCLYRSAQSSARPGQPLPAATGPRRSHGPFGGGGQARWRHPGARRSDPAGCCDAAAAQRGPTAGQRRRRGGGRRRRGGTRRCGRDQQCTTRWQLRCSCCGSSRPPPSGGGRSAGEGRQRRCGSSRPLLSGGRRSAGKGRQRLHVEVMVHMTGSTPPTKSSVVTLLRLPGVAGLDRH